MNIIKISREEFEARKEIPRFPQCPNLSENEIKKITETVFLHRNPQPANVIFVFGSSMGDKWDQVAELYSKGYAPTIYLAGGVSGKSIEMGRVLSHMIRDELIAQGIPLDSILLDEHSTNTLEDALHGKRMFEEKMIPHKRILFACKWPHSGRCLRTLQKVFPECTLFPFPYDFQFNEKILITEEIVTNWWHNEIGRSFVWGEYQRILLYASRGDIHS